MPEVIYRVCTGDKRIVTWHCLNCPASGTIVRGIAAMEVETKTRACHLLARVSHKWAQAATKFKLRSSMAGKERRPATATAVPKVAA